MTAPRRIQLSRKAGWRMPEGAIKVDRTTRWGNPYRVVRSDIGGPNGRTVAGWAVELDGKRMAGSTDKDAVTRLAAAWYGEAVHQKRPGFPTLDELHEHLGGQTLACWCDLPDHDGYPWLCHADWIVSVSS